MDHSLELVCPFRAQACEGRGPRASPSAKVGVAPSGRKQMRIYGALQHPAEPDEFTILDWIGERSSAERRPYPDNGLAELAPPGQPEG